MAIVRELSGNQGSHNSTPNVDLHVPEDDAVVLNYSIPVVPSDTVNLPGGVTEFLIVNTAGNLKVSWPNGTTDTLTLAAGVYRMAILRVWAAGITGTYSAGY